MCTFHQSVWTTGRPIPLRGLLCIVAKHLFWCGGTCSDEMLQLQGRIQWHVNGCVLVSNLSLSPCGLSRELFYSVPLCCALSFGRCSEKTCVCDFHTPLFHFCLAPLCFSLILRTLSRCRVGCVFTVREDLHVTARTTKFPSRGDHSSCCRVDNQHWLRSRSLWMGLTEPVSRWEQRPVWNGKAETWDGREREVTPWTDSFGPRQAPTLGPTGQRSQAPSPSVRRRPLGSGCVAREEHWRRSDLVRKVPTDIAAKLREMLT